MYDDLDVFLRAEPDHYVHGGVFGVGVGGSYADLNR